MYLISHGLILSGMILVIVCKNSFWNSEIPFTPFLPVLLPSFPPFSASFQLFPTHLLLLFVKLPPDSPSHLLKWSTFGSKQRNEAQDWFRTKKWCSTITERWTTYYFYHQHLLCSLFRLVPLLLMFVLIVTDSILCKIAINIMALFHFYSRVNILQKVKVVNNFCEKISMLLFIAVAGSIFCDQHLFLCCSRVHILQNVKVISKLLCNNCGVPQNLKVKVVEPQHLKVKVVAPQYTAYKRTCLGASPRRKLQRRPRNDPDPFFVTWEK